jgi:biotin carboxylase
VEGPESMREFGREHGYPLIVKPARGTASFGVMRLERASEADDAWRRIGALQADRDRGHVHHGGFVVEEYVDGPEYSVEAFTFSGRHVVIAVTEKETLGAVEIRHAMPARLEPGVERNIVDCVTRFLDTIGLRHGPSHTELRVSPAGPRIIESHNRVGGDRISELVHAAYGIDVDTYAVGWPFRLVDELTQRPAPLQAAATRFLSGPPGVVTAVDGADEVLAHPDVVALDVTVAPGDDLRPLSDSWDRPGQVVVTGRSTGEAIATCEDLARRIRLTTRADAIRVHMRTAPRK